jgi:hypothetical protein
MVKVVYILGNNIFSFQLFLDSLILFWYEKNKQKTSSNENFTILTHFLPLYDLKKKRRKFYLNI